MAMVLYSGGCDSTLVLYNLLKDNKRTSGCAKIHALSVVHCQVGANEQNKTARKLFEAEMLKRELYDVVFSDIKIETDFNCSANLGGEWGLTQPIIWAINAVLYAKNEDTIYFGYHSGDDFWIHRVAFEEAIQNMCKVCNKNIKLEYPLKFMSKAEIIKELKVRGLYDLCWYCEYPTIGNTPCGNCLPCKLHRTALWQIDNLNKPWADAKPQQRLEDMPPTQNPEMLERPLTVTANPLIAEPESIKCCDLSVKDYSNNSKMLLGS